MKALLCKKFGPPSDLVVEDIPEPRPDEGQVIVDVAAVGLNFLDTLIIRGKYQAKPEMPFSPGAEFAGTISALGKGVTGYRVGERVAGISGWGSARQKLAIKAEGLVHVPDEVDFDVAASGVIAYGTSYHALKDRGELKPGETLAVLGASGGVGLAAVELGKVMGAKVIACASSDEKLAICKEKGADVLVNYTPENLKDALREATGGQGVDVVYDAVGGDFAEPALRGCAFFSRYLVVGFAAGYIPKIPLNLTLLKSCDIRGVEWGKWKLYHQEINAENDRQIMQWHVERKLKMPIHGVYSLEDMPRALEEFDNRQVVGKVIVHP
ncbi:MAG: NADPH:quinone oxidoreductase family protein [Rhodobiaceae bacterium]|nr:NADPH:quinone oxidoreductase family protein [Rhodobiaceae bacterium]MCC0055519.1 NADPH:quinone oxidoreductase family protein [Rhodobiaceae bacterium]